MGLMIPQCCTCLLVTLSAVGLDDDGVSKDSEKSDGTDTQEASLGLHGSRSDGQSTDSANGPDEELVR